MGLRRPVHQNFLVGLLDCVLPVARWDIVSLAHVVELPDKLGDKMLWPLPSSLSPIGCVILTHVGPDS